MYLLSSLEDFDLSDIVVGLSCGQSYKASTLINYVSRVVSNYDSRVAIYERKMIIRLATGLRLSKLQLKEGIRIECLNLCNESKAKSLIGCWKSHDLFQPIRLLYFFLKLTPRTNKKFQFKITPSLFWAFWLVERRYFSSQAVQNYVQNDLYMIEPWSQCHKLNFRVA